MNRIVNTYLQDRTELFRVLTICAAVYMDSGIKC